MVRVMAVQPDGMILSGGDFGMRRSYPDGNDDTSFVPAASGIVYDLILQPDGRIVAGGSFTSLGGESRNYIGRLNPDGT